MTAFDYIVSSGCMVLGFLLGRLVRNWRHR